MHRAVSQRTLGYIKPQITRDKRFWILEHKVIKLVAIFSSNLNRILKPFSCKESRFSTFTFNHGVGDKGCAVDDLV